MKLGYGESSKGTVAAIGTRPELNVCTTNDDCLATQKCVANKCEDVCTSTTCSGETPDCEAANHSHTCQCTENSCGTAKKCENGKCETCATGSKCNCDGEKVLGSDGTCVCPANLSCSAGQYLNSDCSCKKCAKDYEPLGKCNCPGKTYPDGVGGCYCKEKKSCGEGYSFDSTNTCECVACTSNSSCDNPCPTGTFPTANGCASYECVTDDDCDAGNVCRNGGTESAECVPCGKNEQCRCPDGQLSDGTGKCVSVTCSADTVCSSSVADKCCDAGMQCVNPDTVESYCAACEVDTQCTCPNGYVVNSSGTCVKPACSSYSDCPNGKYCENAGKSDAYCTPCTKGETCTCSGGMVADGNGGCKSADPCADVSCSGGQVCSNGTCGCPSSKPYWSDGYCRACTSDSHCGSSQQYDTATYTCVSVTCPNTTCYSIQNHSCVEKSGCCTSNSQCASNEACVNNTCEEQCGCESYEYCKGGKCYLQAGKCYTHSDCKDGNKCSSHSCVDNCNGVTCSDPKLPNCTGSSISNNVYYCTCTSSSCGSGYVCDFNKCKSTTCSAHSDCVSGKKCVSGSCVDNCSGVTCSDPKYPNCTGSSISNNVYYCTCTSSSCGSGYVCDFDKCKSSATCSSHSDCASGKKCLNGSCVDNCSGVTCSDPRYPNCTGSSISNNVYYCTCTSSSCGSGYVCDYDKCKVPTTEKCSTDDDCSAEKTCVSGYCVFND